MSRSPRAPRRPLRRPLRFNMLGVHWQGTGRVDYRTRSLSGRWSTWQTADADTGPDPLSGELRTPGWHDGNLDWTGASQRRPVPAHRQRHAAARLLPLVEAEGPEAGAHAAARRRAEDRHRARSGRPTRRSRARSRSTRRRSSSPSCTTPPTSNTYTPAEAAAIVRGIEVYHVKGNGWNDIGYNFLVDRFGTVYEGRAGGMTRNVIGAHSLGFNTGTVGVALIGNYARVTPSAAEQSALVNLLAWRLDIAHVDPLSQVVDTSAGNAQLPRGQGRHAARDLGPPRHRARPSAPATPPTRCCRRSRSASRRPDCRSSTRSPRPARSAARSASRAGSPRRCRGRSP